MATTFYKQHGYPGCDASCYHSVCDTAGSWAPASLTSHSAYPPCPTLKDTATMSRFVAAIGMFLTLTVTAYAENLDRAVIARPADDGKMYIEWRLLESDPKKIAFNVYRRDRNGQTIKLNEKQITKTTDFVDDSASEGVEYVWFVRSVLKNKEGSASREARGKNSDCSTPFLSLRLDGKHRFYKVGIANLDGDQRFDYVVKQPFKSTDPWNKVWKRSTDTYKLEAYAHGGRFLWRYDLGWSIECGLWYMPYAVYDLDSDGKAEVAVKTGVGDPRDHDGRVRSGPEYLTILDGQSGKPIAQDEWISREPFQASGELAYNRASRNQICVAYLDGKAPSLIVERGTYGVIILVAYQFRDGKLKKLWRWDNRRETKCYLGQGAHSMHVADVDGDGRQEVIIVSAVIDDDGTSLWSTGLGHPNHCYVGDIDPSRDGLEIYYGIETRKKNNGMCLVGAATGKILWGHDQHTQHIHALGLCSDIDPTQPGTKCYSGECEFEDKRWLRNCKGEVLSTKDLGGLSPRVVHWDADLQRELLHGGIISDYRGNSIRPRVEGYLVAVADILGDWREEIITSMPGKLRIYTTTIPAVDRRTCLMQDPIYRMDVVVAAMGYYQAPMTRGLIKQTPSMKMLLVPSSGQLPQKER